MDFVFAGLKAQQHFVEHLVCVMQEDAVEAVRRRLEKENDTVHSLLSGSTPSACGSLLLFLEECFQSIPVLQQTLEASPYAQPSGADVFEHLLLLNIVHFLELCQAMLPCGALLEVVEDVDKDL